MLQLIFGVLGAFGNHKRKQRKGQPADGAEEYIRGKKEYADMVDDHQNRGEDF